MGLEMATVRNSAENNLLSYNQPTSWIGGRRDKSIPFEIDNQVFRWDVDGTEVCPFWAQPYEPNNFYGSEDCTQIYYNSRWNDLSCRRTLSIICELRTCNPTCDSPLLNGNGQYGGSTYQLYPNQAFGGQSSGSSSSTSSGVMSSVVLTGNEAPVVSNPVSTSPSEYLTASPSTTEADILAGATDLINIRKTQGTHCVTYFQSTVTHKNWQEASDFCISKGLLLASARDHYENNLLATYYGNIWLNGRRKTEDRSQADSEIFIWKAAGYDDNIRCNDYWEMYQPNDALGTESCLKLFYNGEWQDANCASILDSPVICERRYCNPTSTPCDDPDA